MYIYLTVIHIYFPQSIFLSKQVSQSSRFCAWSLLFSHQDRSLEKTPGASLTTSFRIHTVALKLPEFWADVTLMALHQRPSPLS